MICASLLLLAAQGATAEETPAWVLAPTAVVMADGRSESGVEILVQGERIVAVGKDLNVPAGAHRVPLSGVLAPGMVDAFSAFGGAAPAREDSRRLTPMLHAADSINLREDPTWKRLRASGVTSIHVLPAARNVQSGWGTLVTTGGSDRSLATRTRQLLSLHSQTFDGGTGPSSMTGAIEVLEQGNTTGIPGLETQGAIVLVDSAESVRATRRILGHTPLFWMLSGDPASYAGALRGELVGLPMTQDSGFSPRNLDTLKRLHDAGVRVCFGTAAGSSRGPEDLRRAAIAFARATGDPAAAWAAVSTAAAEYAGTGKVGSIGAGQRADLVLWSAHPLDASARVQAVLIGGETVYRAAALPEEEK